MFPSSLLSRLFVHNSLKNNSDGFEFRLKNVIESGTITGLGTLMVDDVPFEPALITIKIGENKVPGDQISRAKPINARAMIEMLIEVRGAPLSEGSHKITIALHTAEAGKVQFSVTEPVAS